MGDGIDRQSGSIHTFVALYQGFFIHLVLSGNQKANVEEMYMLMVNLIHWVSPCILQCDSPGFFFSIVRFTIISIAKQGKVGVKCWDRLLSGIASAHLMVLHQLPTTNSVVYRINTA